MSKTSKLPMQPRIREDQDIDDYLNCKATYYSKKHFVKFYKALFKANNARAVIITFTPSYVYKFCCSDISTLAKVCAKIDYQFYSEVSYAVPKILMFETNRPGCINLANFLK